VADERSTITAAAIATPGMNREARTAVDCDGDWMSDLFRQNMATGEVAEWRMDGFGIAAEAVVASPSVMWMVKT
jgi:hypothetical protein